MIRFTAVPELKAFKDYRRTIDAAIAQSPKQTAIVHIVKPSKAEVDRGPMLKEFRTMLEEYDGRYAIGVLVIASSGFMNAFFRSLATAMLRTVRPSARLFIVDSLEAGAQEILKARGVTSDDGATLKVLKEFAREAETLG